MKKVVSFILATVMIFCLASGLCSAFTEVQNLPTSDYNLTIETKLYRNDGSEWIETAKAMQGEKLKARVFVDTDYYAGHAEMIFFYDKAAFDDGIELSAKFETASNPNYSFDYDISNLKTDSDNAFIKKMVESGYITAEFASEHYAYITMVSINTDKHPYCQRYSGNEWIAEYEFTVKDDFEGVASLLVLAETVRSSDNEHGKIDVNVGSEGLMIVYADTMALVPVNATMNSGVVSTFTDVEFNANSGAFADGSVVTVSKALIGSDFSECSNLVGVPHKTGYTFVSWLDSEGNPVTKISYNDVKVFASWQVNSYKIVLNAGGGAFSDGSFVFAKEVPYNGSLTDIVSLVPAKEGYEFIGWADGNGNLLSENPKYMPASDIYLTAVYRALCSPTACKTEVLNAPKSVYYKGKLNVNGIELKITHADGTSETVTDTSAMNISGFDSSKTGKKTVTVEYMGHSAAFEVNVSYAWWQWIIRILLLGFIWY